MKKIQDRSVIKFRVNLTATIRDAVTGRIKRIQKRHNIIPTVGRAAIASHLTNTSPTPDPLRVNNVAVGTGVDAPANADTKLQTESYRNSVASQTNASNIAYITGFFGATDCNGTYKEAGLFIGGSGTGNPDTGTLLSRVAINITKTNTETLTLDWTITIL